MTFLGRGSSRSAGACCPAQVLGGQSVRGRGWLVVDGADHPAQTKVRIRREPRRCAGDRGGAEPVAREIRTRESVAQIVAMVGAEITFPVGPFVFRPTGTPISAQLPGALPEPAPSPSSVPNDSTGTRRCVLGAVRGRTWSGAVPTPMTTWR